MDGIFLQIILATQELKNSDDYFSQWATISENENLHKTFNYLKNNTTGEIIKLNYPLKFNIETENNGFYYTNEALNICAYGETQVQAENEIASEFIHQYNAYAKEPDEQLDNNARSLKYNLLNIYGGINA